MFERLIIIAMLLIATAAQARGTYQAPNDFVREAFQGNPPPPKLLWLSGEVREASREILGHEPRQLRLRYWAREGRSAWILEEIGKERPITVGLIIDDNRLERVRVLIFRESRGDEVRHPFFTEQFRGARLSTRRQLDRSIDGVSGATLSVRALTKLARLALYLHQQSAAHHETR